MSILDSLKEIGWHLSQEGLDTVSENGQIQDVNILGRKALDYDLRDIGEGAFPEEFTKDPSTLELPIVVQIQKIRNVSAPKANEDSAHAPRMLKLTIHDGKSTCTALETSPITYISINTPPGTKLLLSNEGLEACHGILWLTPSVVTILGGRVSHMIEKWELNRSLAKHTRGGIGVDGGPPPWIPFGRPLEALIEKQFKSIQDQARQDNAEFEAQRKGAIAEAQRLGSGVKKVFGGGTKPLLDANVQKIVDAGFSEEQAERVLRYTKHSVEKALKILTKRDNSEGRSKDKPQKDSEQPPKGRKGRTRDKDLNDDEIPVKPTAKVSLFDFLEDKLPNMPEKDKRQYNNNTEERNERNNHGRDKHSAKSSRHNGSRFDKHKSDNRGHYNDNHHSSHRDDRKYQQQTEKPPRFQRKIEERNKQAQLQQQQQQQRQQMQQQQQQHQQTSNNSNVNVNINLYNSYQPSYHDIMTDMSVNGSIQQQTHQPTYRHSMDGLTEAAASLMLSSPPRESMPEVQRYNSPPDAYANAQTLQDIQSYRRADVAKYQEQYQRRQNGYLEAQQVAQAAQAAQAVQAAQAAQQATLYSGLGYAPAAAAGYAPAGRQYAAYPRQEYGSNGGATLFAGSLLGFQHAGVNEQARAMLGVSEISWHVGDRCLALYWEDNNYYEAEVTGVSANTVVVKFCAYGNHEEVLKTNCLPFHNQAAAMGSGYAARGATFARRP